MEKYRWKNSNDSQWIVCKVGGGAWYNNNNNQVERQPEARILSGLMDSMD